MTGMLALLSRLPRPRFPGVLNVREVGAA
jgi:hypothetical protein